LAGKSIQKVLPFRAQRRNPEHSHRTAGCSDWLFTNHDRRL